MRLPGCLTAALVITCLDPTYTYGQSSDQHRLAETIEPYHKHRDTRHGHDHFYPDRGSVIRDLPPGTIGVNYAGASYRYHDGVWLEPRGPAFVVVAPPIGLVVPTLPTFSTILAHDGRTYLYCNDTYYQPRPDLGGYEVINDPTNAQPPAGPDVFVGGLVPGSGSPSTQPASAARVVTASTVPAPAAVAALSSAPAAVPAAATVGPTTPAGLTTPSAAAAPIGLASPVGVATSPSSGIAVPVSAVTPPPAVAPAPNTTAALATPLQPAVSNASAPPISATTLATTAVGSAPPAPTQPPTTPPATVPPTAAPSTTQTPALPKGPKVFAYPRNGQSTDQQARDRYDCYRFAVAQSGFDPMHSTSGSTTSGSTAANSELQSDYDRAQAACFDARGYTIR